MKTFQKQAVEYLSASVRQREQEAKAQAAAEAERKKAADAEARQPKGNRRQRRAQARFNTLLNRKISKAGALGQGVSVSIGKDGGVHVNVAKPKLVGDAQDQAAVDKALEGPIVRGEELEQKLEQLEAEGQEPCT